MELVVGAGVTVTVCVAVAGAGQPAAVAVITAIPEKAGFHVITPDIELIVPAAAGKTE